MTTGEKIRKRRIQLGLTVQKIADACNVSKATISRWETGKTDKINLDVLMCLSNVLIIEPFELLDDDYSKKMSSENTLIDSIILKVNKLSKEELIKLDNLIDLMFKR